MLTINFRPFQNLETNRLYFRQVNHDVAPEVLALRGNAETMKYIPRPLATNLEDAFAHIDLINDKIEKNIGINWGIVLKGTTKIIGIIGHYRIQPENHRAEIGYMFLPEHHGKGYATEAIKAIVDYGFNEMNLHSIEAIIDPENTASEKTLLKNGFVKEAHILENELFDGKFWDTVIYSLLKRNYEMSMI
jgi:ribosomal-protein-alanine N-acetyltransferase